MNIEIEVHDWQSLNRKHRKEEEEVLWVPKEMTEEVADYLDSFGLL